MAFNLQDTYATTHAVLALILWIAVFVIWMCALFMVRRNADPARRAFTFLKIALPLFWVFLLWDMLENLLVVVASRVRFSDAFLALQVFDVLARFCETLTHLVLFLLLVHLGLGILLARTGQPARLHRPATLAALCAVALLFVIEIAHVGVAFRVVAANSARLTIGNASPALLVTSWRLDTSILIILFVLNIALVAYGVIVLGKVSKTHSHLKTPAVYLLVCPIILLVRYIFEIVNIGVYRVVLGDFIPQPQYLRVLSIIFRILPPFIVIVLMFALGSKKISGLWSAQQPGMVNTTGGVPVPAQHMQPQYAQYGQYPNPPPGFVYAYGPPGQGWQQAQPPQTWQPPVQTAPVQPVQGQQMSHLQHQPAPQHAVPATTHTAS